MMGRNTFAFIFTFLFALSRYSCKCESLDRCNSKVRMVTLETSELTERKMDITLKLKFQPLKRYYLIQLMLQFELPTVELLVIDNKLIDHLHCFS